MFGLDISDHSIEVVQMRSRTKVKTFGRVILPEGIVKNGLILKKELLVSEIKRALLKAKIRSKKVFVSIPESKAFIHVFDSKKNIEEEAKKTIPWEPGDVYFDVYNNIYVAVPKNVIDSYVGILKLVGLKLVGFDVESLALARALEANNSLVIDIGARTTNLSVFDNKEQVKITVNVAKGGDNFTRAIAEKLKVSLKEAEKLKIKKGLDMTMALQKEFEPIIKQVRKIGKLYEKEIKQIILVGGSAQMPKIVDYFSSNSGLKTYLGKSKLIGKPIFYNVAIGLALKKYKWGINILPNIKTEVKSFNKKWLAILFVTISSLFLGFIIYLLVFHYRHIK